MLDLSTCAYCGRVPDRITGKNWMWQWFQVRCRNPHCVEHGTVRHITQGRADRLWNIRQANHRNILRHAATASTHKEPA